MLAATATLATPLMGGEPDLVVDFVRGSLADMGINGGSAGREVGGVAVVVPDAGGGENGIICCCQGGEDEEDGREGGLGERWHFLLLVKRRERVEWARENEIEGNDCR